MGRFFGWACHKCDPQSSFDILFAWEGEPPAFEVALFWRFLIVYKHGHVWSHLISVSL